MDWRSGSRQNPNGSAFRGISSRSRGRGRGRGAPFNTRGSCAGTPHVISPSVTAAPLPSPPPPPPPPTQLNTPPSVNPSPTPKPSRRGSHQPSRHIPSLSRLDTSRAPVVPSIEPSTTPGGRPQVGRRAPPNYSNVSTLSLPPLKLDPSTPTTPVSTRPKTPRKRSHNRTRSSSKASTIQQLSSAPSTSSPKENSREAPPHMTLHSDGQSFVPRTDIDTLVERVRAMAMAGSAVDKEKDREGNHIPHDGHIDWAGDEDDTLPDLDDWVRPKQAQQKETEKAELDKSSQKPSLPQLEEIADPSPPSEEKGVHKKSVLIRPEPEDIVQQVQDERDPMKPKTAIKEVEAFVGKPKFRGKHGRKKIPVSEATESTLAMSLTGSEIRSSEALGLPKPRPPLVHPLPPKPQLSAASVRGFRSRGPVHTNLPVTSTSDNTDELPLAVPQEVQSAEPPPTQAVKPVTETENKVDAASPKPQVTKKAFDASTDLPDSPQMMEESATASVREASDAPSSTSSTGKSPDTKTRKRAFDPSVDWSKAPSVRTVRSPTRPTSSPIPFGGTSYLSHPAPSHDRSRGSSPHRNSSRSSARASPLPHLHTRSQMNSPERSPHRWQDRVGQTHLRAHSSPQTGPGTRSHTSRPVITLDALSRISRTLGVPGATTPPRGPAAEVVVAD